MADEAIIPVQKTVTTTETTDKPQQEESKIFGLTIRGIIAYTLVVTICIESFTRNGAIPETLVGLASTVVAFYFGHEQGKSTK